MKINQNNCLSCGQCVEACPYAAIMIIKTHGYARFKIDQSKCMSCGECKEVCPGECISDN